MHRSTLLVLSLGVLTQAGCRSKPDGPAEGQGSFSVAWVGSDTGKLDATPRAAFCQEGNLLEVMASRGDVGVGLVLYPESLLVSGPYQGFDPQDSIIRPGVAAAARWFTERDIRAFQGRGGSLTLVKRGQEYSADFGLQLRRVGADSDSIVLRGKFQGVLPGPCGSAAVSLPDSSQ